MNNVEYSITLLNDGTIYHPSAVFTCLSDRASPVNWEGATLISRIDMCKFLLRLKFL